MKKLLFVLGLTGCVTAKPAPLPSCEELLEPIFPAQHYKLIDQEVGFCHIVYAIVNTETNKVTLLMFRVCGEKPKDGEDLGRCLSSQNIPGNFFRKDLPAGPQAQRGEGNQG